MLERLLAEIRSGGALEVGTLAKKLDASPQLVEAMLEHLQRAGYIRPYEACGEGCHGCSLKTQCDRSRRDISLKLWQG
ncbi:MAG: hypothetical protein Fur0043_20180 [Anaerolineales bacterium]